MPCALRVRLEGLVDTFKDRLRESMTCETRDVPSVHVDRHKTVYRTGDPADGVYFVETGLIKLSVLAPGGKECLLAIHAPGDVFGELCLGGADVVRQEMATAMEDTTLKAIPVPRVPHPPGSRLAAGGLRALPGRARDEPAGDDRAPGDGG